MNQGQNIEQYDFKNTLLSYGYEFCSVIKTTLQGQIIKAKMNTNNNNNNNNNNDNSDNSDDSDNSNEIVIKISNKMLSDKGVTIKNDVEIPVEENIINEKCILQLLTNANPPPYMINFIDYFDDEENHFLIMEDGEMCLFDFVRKFHSLYIPNNILTIKSWQHTCELLFKQMITFIDWLHNKMSICHLDISLENLLISNVNIMYNNATNQMNIVDNFKVRFCDFGLAEKFPGQDFRSEKYVGKTSYKAPKVYGKKDTFDARLADVWSLGVVLFMLSVGSIPFKKPSKDEDSFNLIMNGRLHQILIHLKKTKYVTPQLYRLLYSIFKKEEHRITVKEILEHSYFN